ncbi:MAG: HAMP domain-containing protein [Bacteroidia bacterium]|nr:HAMP domain-containing protein [Bacteroidia bacterium]
MISLRNEKKNRIEQFFLDRFHDITLDSESEEIKKLITNINQFKPKNPQSDSFPDIEGAGFEKFINPYAYYENLNIVGLNELLCKFNLNDTSRLRFTSDGQAEIKICMANKVKDKNFQNFLKIIGKTGKKITHDINPILQTRPEILIGNPVYDNAKKIVGFVVLEIPIDAINKIMFEHSDNSGLGKTGETYLVGSDYLMRSNSRFIENAVRLQHIKVTSKAVIEAFQNKTGYDIIRDYRNVPCFSAYSPVNIEGLNWVILAEIDVDEAMIQIYPIRNSILLITIIIATAVFVFTFFISKKIAAPLRKLQKASEEVGKGNYEVKLNIKTSDEIGQLTDSFNQMTIKLKKQTDEIQEEKKRRLSALIDGQENERQRLSRELHDGLGQSIAALKLRLEKDLSGEESLKKIDHLETLFEPLIDEVHKISNDLMPSVLTAFGLVNALRNLCDEISEHTNIIVHFETNSPDLKLEEKQKIYLFRITQECLNNSVKHSGCTDIFVVLNKIENYILLSIIDNGKGLDLKAIKERKGLSNIRERINILNGELEITSEKDKGTKVEVKLVYS